MLLPPGNIRTAEQARFSLEYAVSAAILDGEISLRHFQEEMIAREKTRDLMKKVVIRIPPDLQSLESKRNRYGEVRIYLSDGGVLTHRATQIRGHPPLFLSDEEVEKKFFDCSDPVLGRARAQELLNTLRRIETVPSVRDVVSLIRLSDS